MNEKIYCFKCSYFSYINFISTRIKNKSWVGNINNIRMANDKNEKIPESPAP